MGPPNQPGSASSLSASPLFELLNQLYAMLQIYYPDWCREKPFYSLVNNRTDAELAGLAGTWKQCIDNYCMPAPIV